MIHLALSIACSTAILFLFKLMEARRIPLLYPIIINYAVAAGLGFALAPKAFAPGTLIHSPWLPAAMGTGALFIAMFFLMGQCTQRAGIAVTTIAGKMSVVLPMLFSALYYTEPMGPLKLTGIGLALAALALVIVQKPHDRGKTTPFLPLVLFAGLGGLDSLLKLVQEELLPGRNPAGFTGVSFFFALATGLFICLGQKRSPAPFIRPRVGATGILLGLVNFGSVYFLIQALANCPLDSSIVFAVNSIGVVCASIFLAALGFGESLSRTRWAGVGMALAAIITFIHV
ncbi:MAG: hypothetical protein MI747_05485 [Desulfobacterales bacterium]|nr:hypothetical protein [Desulfobacterales bacterium]